MPKDKIEIADEEFDSAVDEKHHKELVSVLRQVLLATKEGNGKDEIGKIARAIEKYNGSVELLASKIKEPKAPEAPKVTVTTDNKELLSCMEKIEKGQTSIIELLQQLLEVRKADVELTVTRNHFSQTIEKVTAKTIFNTKPKYQA